MISKKVFGDIHKMGITTVVAMLVVVSVVGSAVGAPQNHTEVTPKELAM